jgi:hypothetical protein
MTNCNALTYQPVIEWLILTFHVSDFWYLSMLMHVYNVNRVWKSEVVQPVLYIFGIYFNLACIEYCMA